MDYKMSPREYFRKIIELYRESREPKFYNPNIKRGRSSSISSGLEDLTALFIALNSPKQCQYYTDQPMKFEGSTTKYPDILIQNSDGLIKNLIDVKTDLGWNRNGMYTFCKGWEERIEAVKNIETSFKQGKNKHIQLGKFSKYLKYHILVVTKINSGKMIDEDMQKVRNDFSNVRLYVLSDKQHPNDYKFSNIEETLNGIEIINKEFERLFRELLKTDS